MIIFIVFVVFLALALLGLSVLLSPHAPYNQKNAAFECGFDSFRGQNRSEFNISFFLFALLFLLFDVEIMLIFPYSVSSYNNSLYGLFFVVIFLLLLTAGFVYEFARGALVINSKQTGYLSNPNSESDSSDISNTNHIKVKKSRGNFNLYTNQRRMYSTKSTPGRTRKTAKKQPCSRDEEFWRKVNTRDALDNNNPFTIVNSFIKKHPNNDGQISFKLISSIITLHTPNYKMIEEEFNALMNISPRRLELPVKDKKDLAELVGKSVRSGKKGVAGAYIFINKTNGYCYVGSSISLANRLATGYLGTKIGDRKIDLAIKDAGLGSFYLDIYILPANLVETLDNSGNVTSPLGKIKVLTLALEQILLLVKNPEYNVLKVAGSPAGLKRTPESLLPSLLKTSKAVYFYDDLAKELLYIATSRTALGKAINYDPSSITRYIQSNTLPFFF